MKGIPCYFGEIAIAEGYITEQKLQECLHIQKRNSTPPPIGEILVAHGVLTEEQVVRILKVQQVYKSKLTNEYFAHVAIKKGVLSYNKVHHLRRQYQRELAHGRPTDLPTLAKELKYASENKVDELLSSTEYKHYQELRKKTGGVIAGYELVGQIENQKKVAVHKAIQIDLDRLVAVKILRSGFESEDNILRFFYEAKITARFNHPNLVRIYDKGWDNDTYYFSMELVEGKNLADKLEQEGRLQVGEAVRLMRQIASALQHIHSYQKIHSEINPRCIAIRDDGVGKLLQLSSCISVKKERISSGKINKMPQYMAPEQFSPGEPLNIRTDIYCLGATFYRMLTGQPPVVGKNIDEIRASVCEHNVKSIDEIDHTIPEDLAKIVHRMIRRDPARRYPEIKNVLFAMKKLLI